MFFSLLSSCSRDNTLKYAYTKGAFHNFSVSAFRFKENYDDVYIHCKLTVCRESDTGSRCDRGCEAGRRRKRSIQEDFSAKVRIGPLSYKNMVDKKDGMCNRPFPSSKKSHFQNEAKCETFVVKMSFICIIIEKSFSYQWFRT